MFNTLWEFGLVDECAFPFSLKNESARWRSSQNSFQARRFEGASMLELASGVADALEQRRQLCSTVSGLNKLAKRPFVVPP
eukprot:4651296-Pleurochrysis_carterae.AAC.4